MTDPYIRSLFVTYALATAVAWLIGYALVAFASWEINPAHWPAPARVALVVFDVYTMVALIRDMKTCGTLA